MTNHSFQSGLFGVKFRNLLAFFLVFNLVFSACKKEDDDDPKKSTTVDISGTYLGDATYKADVPGVGENEINDDNVGIVISASGNNTYLIDGDDGITSTVTLTGSAFTSTSGTSYWNKGINGTLDGSTLNFIASGQVGDTLFTTTYSGMKQ